MKFRKNRPNPEDLKEISKDELAQHRNWLSCLGYVINIEKETFVFGSHRGRDISSRILMHFNGISMDTNDDKGQVYNYKQFNFTKIKLIFILKLLINYFIATIPSGQRSQ